MSTSLSCTSCGDVRCAAAPSRCKPSDDALAIGERPILRKLPVADEARDRNLDADDGAEQLVDVVRRRIAHLPGIGAARFVSTRQVLDQLAQPRGVMQ